MSQFYHNRNTDNVFFRELIISVLNFLTDKITIQNVTSASTTDVIVPFLYNASGDERFMQDLFLQNTMSDCIDLKIVEGNIEVIPRGQLTLTSLSINAANLTNRYVYGQYLKEIDGELKTFYAPIHLLPISASFDSVVIVDGRLNMFKILEKLMQVFYKAHKFSFLHRGINIEVEIGFPNESAYESTYEFSFGDNTTNKIPFNITCNTFYPVIDNTEEMQASNNMETFTLSWQVPEQTPRKVGVDSYIAIDPAPIPTYTDIESRKNAIVQDEGKANYDPEKILEEELKKDEEFKNVDNNLHRPGQFGTLTKTLNEEIKKY